MSRSRILNLANIQQFAAINVLTDPGAIGGPKVIPQAAEITLRWILGNAKFGHNVLIGRYSGTFTGSPAQANSILTALSSGAQWSALAGFLGTTMALNSVTIRDLNTANQPVIASTAAGANGTSTGIEMPNEVAVAVTLRTAFTGPQNRGRMFVPGWASNALGTGNVVTPAAVTALQNWAGIIAGVLSAQSYTWCVGHVARQAYTGSTGTSHPARVAGTVPITTVEVRDNHWDTIRRRGLR